MRGKTFVKKAPGVELLVDSAPWSKTTRRGITLAGGLLIGESYARLRQAQSDFLHRPVRRRTTIPGCDHDSDGRCGTVLPVVSNRSNRRIMRAGTRSFIRLIRQSGAESKPTFRAMQIKSSISVMRALQSATTPVRRYRPCPYQHWKNGPIRCRPPTANPQTSLPSAPQSALP
jgi:hypothetical protein